MAAGAVIRLNRIMNCSDHRTLIGTLGHGSVRGPIEGEGPAKDLAVTFGQLSRVGLDAVIISPGMLNANAAEFAGGNGPGLIVGLQWTNNFLAFPFRGGTSAGSQFEGRAVMAGSVEDALAIGADGILTYLFLGSSDAEAEARQVAENIELSRACERFGVARIIETMIRGRGVSREDETNPDHIAAAARIAYEVGCDIVKVEWPGSEEGLARVVEACPTPIVVAGGDRVPEDEFVLMAKGVVNAGGSGLVVGRNIVQATRKEELVRELHAVVHGPMTRHQSPEGRPSKAFQGDA
jgi:DhnA family fructose-bisphosphate aldolase class Ia